MYRRNILVIVLILISLLTHFTSQVSAQGISTRSPRHDRLPTVQQIIERYLQALGGRAAWLKTKSQYVSGTIEVPATGNKGTFEVYARATNQSFLVMRFPTSEFRSGFDGQRSWTQVGENPAQYDPPEKQQPNKPELDFYKILNFTKHYPNAKVTGIEEVEGVKAYVVEATWVGGKDLQKFFFDTRTGLLILRDDGRVGDDGKKTVDMMYYSDYREVDGIKLACSLRIVQGEQIIITRYTEVKNNIVMDDAMFNLPASK